MEKQISQPSVNPTPQKKQIDYVRIAMEKLRSVMDWSPKELYQHLDHMGYVGQQETRRRLCLMAYRHIRRLKDHYINNIPLDELPPKSNVLMTGPTGCGKSYLSELLFGLILQIPVVTVDMTGYVETGYVGKYVSEILYNLLTIADGNPHWAQMGICVLDEFDKLAGAGGIRSGGRTSKDITGFGVQRGLLKLIEGGMHETSSRGPFGHKAEHSLQTDCIGFVACGAFSGMENPTVKRNNNSFGFGTSRKQVPSQNNGAITSVEVFSRYGFLPELIGRFSSIAHLSPLGKTHLMTILKKNVLPKYKQEFKREGNKLTLPKKVMEEIVEKAIVRKTGARGIAFLLTEYFEKQAFDCFGQNDEGRY